MDPMDLIGSFHPGANEPAVLVALSLATLWLVVGGFFILRPIARRRPFTWRLFALHVLGLGVLLAGVRPLESLAVRGYYAVTRNPWSGVVSADVVQLSWLPYLAALALLAVPFIFMFLRSANGLRATNHPSENSHA